MNKFGRHFTIGGWLTPGETYDLRVFATKDKADDGPPSAEQTATTPAYRAWLSATNPAPLTEENLNGATLTVDLEGSEWEPWVHQLGHRVLLSGMTGVWVDRVEWISAAQLAVTLRYNGTDFDDDAVLAVTIRGDLHTWGKDITLSVPVAATVEADAGHMTSVSATGRDNEIAVSWAPVDAAGAYKLEWKGPGEDYAGHRRVITPITWHIIRDLEPGTEYTVRVTAFIRRIGYLPWSRETTAMTTPVAPVAVTVAVDDEHTALPAQQQAEPAQQQAEPAQQQAEPAQQQVASRPNSNSRYRGRRNPPPNPRARR